MPDYTGKTVAITGAGSGLGAAMADLFAGAGARIALIDIDGDRVTAKAAELAARGAEALALVVDVADNASVEGAAAAVAERFGGCDVLCANVGVQQFGAIGTLTRNDWSWVMSVNFHGVVNTVDAFLPLLRRQAGKRHIVVTSSASYFQLGVRMAAYVSSKFAVTGFAEVLRQELASEGINVAIMFPAGMLTRHLESSMAARPALLGESRFDMADVQAMMASADIDLATHMLSAEEAVSNLLAELEQEVPYIVTHGGYRHQVEQRHQEVMAAFDRMAAYRDT